LNARPDSRRESRWATAKTTVTAAIIPSCRRLLVRRVCRVLQFAKREAHFALCAALIAESTAPRRAGFSIAR
jgi:hypothetical protein